MCVLNRENEMLTHTKMEANGRTSKKNELTDVPGVIGGVRLRKKGSLASQILCLWKVLSSITQSHMPKTQPD